MNEHEKIVITKYDLLYEQRMSRVETTLEHFNAVMVEVKHDIRWMLGLMITFSAIILGLMAKGFHWI